MAYYLAGICFNDIQIFGLLSSKLPDPPELRGALTKNNLLATAGKLHFNTGINGPQSFYIYDGWLYSGLSDGRVVEISPTGTVRTIMRMSLQSCGDRRILNQEVVCGRPLGIRLDPKGYLVVADAYNGIYKINPVNGYEQYALFNARRTLVKGRPTHYINDLAIATDGTIFFSSSSSYYGKYDYLNIILEAETSGRVLIYKPPTRERNYGLVDELVTTLNFPTGLELSADENILYVAEGARSRIFKVYVGSSHPKRGMIELFVENLPGYVNNIRRTQRGTLWVGLQSARYKGRPNILDRYGQKPFIRSVIMKMRDESIVEAMSKYGMAVEVNEHGKILRSIHDNDGNVFDGVSEVQEWNGLLYVGSSDGTFIGLIDLSNLPPVYTPPVTEVSLLQNMMSLSETTLHGRLFSFLDEFKHRLRQLPFRKARNIAMMLVQRLLESRYEAARLKQQLQEIQKEFNVLQNSTRLQAYYPSTKFSEDDLIETTRHLISLNTHTSTDYNLETISALNMSREANTSTSAVIIK